MLHDAAARHRFVPFGSKCQRHQQEQRQQHEAPPHKVDFRIIRMNSSSLTSPSSSLSASLIISISSSSDMVSPSSFATAFRSSKDILPLGPLKSRKAFCICSLESFSLIFAP